MEVLEEVLVGLLEAVAEKVVVAAPRRPRAATLLAAPCDAYFRGDPVQTFKRMQYMGKRSVWSDVLVGQGPLFGVDRAVELNYPSSEVPSQDTLKMQLSYDNEKFTSEWITLSDGRGHQLDLITAVFVFSGSEIHDVQHRLTYKKLTADDAPGHRDHRRRRARRG